MGQQIVAWITESDGSDGCLVHLAGLKLKKSALKLGEEGLCRNFCGWLSESQKSF